MQKHIRRRAFIALALHLIFILLTLIPLNGHQINVALAEDAQPDVGHTLHMPYTRQSPPISSIQVDAGNNYSCAIQSSALYCWGLNDYGQLGDGTTTTRFTPGLVSGLSSGVSAVAAGSGLHTCAIVNGGAKCWGYNVYGQLGNDTESDSLTPVEPVGLDSGVTAITAGDFHTCAVVNGAAKCWGYNAHGRAGLPMLSEYHTPIDVPGLESGVTAISAGRDFTCALVNGGVQCWGNNTYGQLGNATNDASAVPTQVVGLTSGVQAIATGDHHACAFLVGGGIKCWGRNQFGQLGNNIFAINANMPVDVVNLTGIVGISAGKVHSCAITLSGARCWGGNQFGQLGDGTMLDRQVPVAVSDLVTGVTAINGGSYHSCAVANNALYCWGENRYGALGDGSTINNYVPVLVAFN